MIMGVVVLTFHSSDVIEACLNSLIASDHADLRIVVVDNNSKDNTVALVKAWAQAQALELADGNAGVQGARITLIETGANLGFAGGVNRGLAHLQADPQVELFWVLNPDSEALPVTARAYAEHAAQNPGFGLMSGRTLYHEAPRLIQSDGGRVRPWSGVCEHVNSRLAPEAAIRPDPGTLDFVSGANMVASRAFLDQVGLMVEDYFLYFEEVDWAARRGNLPLVICEDALVLHHGGTVIGSGTVSQAPSPFSNFFNYRNRMRFMRRFSPMRLPVAWGVSMLKIAKMVLQGDIKGAWGGFTGLNGFPPPRAIRDRIAPEDREMAFRLRDRTR